jgi:hypothetical protein
MRRALWIGAVVALAGIAAAIWFVSSSLDAVVARAIERHGSELTGVAVRVGSVEIDLRSGRGTLRGLSVANPPGFGDGDALHLDEITLDLDPASLAGSPVRVDEVVIGAPEVRWVADARGRSNVQEILDHVKQQGKASVGGRPGGDPGGTGAREETLLVVHRLEFREGKVAANLEAVDAGSHEGDLPSVALRDLGAPGGAPAGVIGARVAEAYGSQVVRTVVAREVGRRIGEAIGNEAGEVGRALEILRQRARQPGSR